MIVKERTKRKKLEQTLTEFMNEFKENKDHKSKDNNSDT